MSLVAIDAPILMAGQTVPLVRLRASAGFPSPAGDDLEEEIDPVAYVVRHPASTFWWQVEGDCLWDVGIRDGDLIAVDRAGKRRLGRAVLAMVEGAMTAKILERRGERYVLVGANGHAPVPEIELTADHEVWGVIAGVVRRYDLG